ncbi:pyoverdine/dityrosine biosynthesis protein [Chaetomium fimeti]|uniref:Pyoverdine/dityrosine biosynthesis protein n=1 Tax=Chaetomium fimeti TaxID=1854472 RepID=A0AAE0H873_9PEZI|nr:pyoverdine/dityrosine biosynthesis protein [Chaetomium fimeti]
MNDLSAYHRFCCAFVRAQDGELFSCTGPFEEVVREHWAHVSAAVASPSEQRPLSLIKVDAIHHDMLELYERHDDREHRDTILGIILQRPSDAETGFDDIFASLMLDGVRLFTSSAPQGQPSDTEPELRAVAHKITDLFDTRLRYLSENDKWNDRGRGFFFGWVYEFVRRGARVEFCLPAFPCKSSNPDKVVGVVPDRGEQLALQHLDSFIEAIEGIYEPGAKLWIVSDGHVFSDCIGVDDDIVDLYSAELISMYAAIRKRSSGSADRIGFQSLIDMFGLANSTAEMQQWHALQLPSPEVHIPTQRTRAAELSRQMLLRAGRSNDRLLRARITSGDDHSTLKLYRGFSRFMAEDLRLNRHTRHLSRCKLKKLAAKVAFEMLQRNEAYSNLVELFFPHAVRLSIHAHDNAGPKFGIRLFGLDVRAVEQLNGSDDGPEMRSVDLLHVPTPWHNCLALVVAGQGGGDGGGGGGGALVMTKSKVVRDALSEGALSGGWADEGHQGVAGCFRLQKKLAPRCEVSAEYAKRSWDAEDMLDCCDPGNPYFWGPEAGFEVDMRHWRAWAGSGLF